MGNHWENLEWWVSYIFGITSYARYVFSLHKCMSPVWQTWMYCFSNNLFVVNMWFCCFFANHKWTQRDYFLVLSTFIHMREWRCTHITRYVLVICSRHVLLFNQPPSPLARGWLVGWFYGISITWRLFNSKSCLYTYIYIYIYIIGKWRVRGGSKVLYDIVCYLTPFWVILFVPHIILLV